ncbi:hypothetical protein ACJX0J_040799 [Zea mays]
MFGYKILFQLKARWHASLFYTSVHFFNLNSSFIHIFHFIGIFLMFMYGKKTKVSFHLYNFISYWILMKYKEKKVEVLRFTSIINNKIKENRVILYKPCFFSDFDAFVLLPGILPLIKKLYETYIHIFHFIGIFLMFIALLVLPVSSLKKVEVLRFTSIINNKIKENRVILYKPCFFLLHGAKFVAYL